MPPLSRLSTLIPFFHTLSFILCLPSTSFFSFYSTFPSLLLFLLSSFYSFTLFNFFLLFPSLIFPPFNPFFLSIQLHFLHSLHTSTFTLSSLTLSLAYPFTLFLIYTLSPFFSIIITLSLTHLITDNSFTAPWTHFPIYMSPFLPVLLFPPFSVLSISTLSFLSSISITLPFIPVNSFPDTSVPLSPFSLLWHFPLRRLIFNHVLTFLALPRRFSSHLPSNEDSPHQYYVRECLPLLLAFTSEPPSQRALARSRVDNVNASASLGALRLTSTALPVHLPPLRFV